MPFIPKIKKEVSIKQPYQEALKILEDNNIDWIFQSTVQHYSKDRAYCYDIGILKDFGIIELRESEGKVSMIKLHLNWFDNSQTFKGDCFNINAHYSFPNGQGEMYKACNIEVNNLFMTINEIQSKGHTIFPFLSPNLMLSSDMFPLYIRENTTTSPKTTLPYNIKPQINIVEYFASLLSKEHRNSIGDLQSEIYKTNHNSFIYKTWNDLNAANKKILQTKQWNEKDTQFNNEVGYILRTYDELFYDEKHMKIINDFISSDIFCHTMACGLNITHVIALVEYQPLHDLLYEKFISLNTNHQDSLLNTSDNTGLTLPLLHLYHYNFLKYDSSKEHSLELFNKYLHLPNFRSSLVTKHASLYDILPLPIYSEVLSMIQDESMNLPYVYHVHNNVFNQYFNYKYTIEGQNNILSWLKENYTPDQTLHRENRQKAALLHNFWLTQKVNTIFDCNKNNNTVKKLKI